MVCSSLTAWVEDQVASWVELYPDHQSRSVVSVLGERSTLEEIQLPDLLSINRQYASPGGIAPLSSSRRAGEFSERGFEPGARSSISSEVHWICMWIFVVGPSPASTGAETKGSVGASGVALGVRYSSPSWSGSRSLASCGEHTSTSSCYPPSAGSQRRAERARGSRTR